MRSLTGSPIFFNFQGTRILVMTSVVVIINSVLRSLTLHSLHLGLRQEKIETGHRSQCTKSVNLFECLDQQSVSQLGSAKPKFTFTDSPTAHLLQQEPQPRKKVRYNIKHFVPFNPQS